ncbi:MAG: hypothetical protein SFW08_00210, partial [Gemmatimonadaceae bacterium]|nr:hypothetical protein [Gemmatimonadaceae bacterium]
MLSTRTVTIRFVTVTATGLLLGQTAAAQTGAPSSLPPATARPAPAGPVSITSPLADSLAPMLVYPPPGQPWFLAASRGGRLLLDVGRVDVETKKRTDRIPVIAALAEAHGTVPKGTRLLLRGPWGREVATVTGFDVWSGRIVATLAVSALADSLAKLKTPLVASAFRLNGAAPPADDVPSPDASVGCAKDSLLRQLKPRLARVRDSLVQVTRAMVPRITVYQQARKPKPAMLRTTSGAGCFDAPKALVVVSLRGENYEWVAQKAVLISASGASAQVGVSDLRFTGHE